MFLTKYEMNEEMQTRYDQTIEQPDAQLKENYFHIHCSFNTNKINTGWHKYKLHM